MTINNKVRVIIPAFVAVVVLGGVVTAVSAQDGSPAESVEALTAQLQEATRYEAEHGQTIKDVAGNKILTGESAKKIDALHKKAAQAYMATLERPVAERAGAIANIKAFAGNPNLDVAYLATTKSAYNYKVISEAYRVGRNVYEVDSRTDEIIQFGPAPMVGDEQPKTFNLEPRFNAEELEAKALGFIAKKAPNADFSKLEASQSNKAGTAYFFRWDDTSREVDDLHPFVQVGYTIGGDILSYTNTLGL